MLPNMPNLPREHRHGLDSDADLRCDVQQGHIDLATIEHTVEKRPLIGGQFEQEGESFATEHNGFLDPRVDLSPGGKTVARQTDCEFPAKFARIALDGVDRPGAPVAPPAGAQGQYGSLDPVPVEPVDGQDTPRVEEVAGCMPGIQPVLPIAAADMRET